MLSSAAGPIDKTAIRHAATVILLRDAATRPCVLMGQRGAKAAFMPNKFVFPGGAVDDGDGAIPLANGLNPACTAKLADHADAALIPALQAAAIREVWEETGLILGQPGQWTTPPPPDWETFAATDHVPSAEGFTFVFRAITPPGRPRRFDARFFMVDAGAIQGDPDDFSHASDELSQLQWIPIDEVRQFDLPFITEVVLAEVAGIAKSGQPPETVPFFNNSDEESLFLRLAGRRPLDHKDQD
ncbi:NUDIX hydrolase [Aliiroseovarius sp. YM-037]|uniref:NUDIX hydrolase n=1 Tax=Aliiroseovarius sp. YM-037 TaxID=3341728 RepID=UPI003A7F6CB8